MQYRPGSHTGSTTFFFIDPSVEPFTPYPEKYLSCALELDKIVMQGNKDIIVAGHRITQILDFKKVGEGVGRREGVR